MKRLIGILSLVVVTQTIAANAGMTGTSLSAVPGSFKTTTDIDIGEFSAANMAVEVVLAPANQSQLDSLLSDLYNPKSASYQQWLGKGEFYSRFAPSDAQVAAVVDHLQASGLQIERSSSPFLVRASGSSEAVAAAFGTTLHNRRNSKGVSYFSNASALQVPTSIASGVLGVVGLSSTIRPHSHAVRPQNQHYQSPGCEAPHYVTAAELFAYVNDGTGIEVGYGGGPGCNGLTPSQTNSIYGAPDVGPDGRGAGVNFAVFEMSAYQRSDIETWATHFYGAGYTPPLVDIIVDGGPLNPVCPISDTCPAQYNGYSGDIEVDADIEMTLAIAPNARQILVYNAPFDYTGQTELDEYARIADDNTADVTTTSWGFCENDAGAAYVQAENLIFEQMAVQGQSMFADAGDTGAFDCIRSDGTTIISVDDPGSQPWVTSVGGTSFESFNPGSNPHPDYPTGVETVWNVDELCNQMANEGGTSASPLPGAFWCAETGAGGGGYSQFWGRPGYQSGPGVNNRYTVTGNGTTQCSLAANGTPCREVPDVSANADPFTPYAEYCTGSAATPYSTCAIFSGYQIPAGWFGIGGTSLSSPLWSAILGDRAGYFRHRIGNANWLLYSLFRTNHSEYFNDITGIRQATHDNGLFPTTPGYDMATGIGTPKMKALITGDEH
jgi:subtilase family serine protease